MRQANTTNATVASLHSGSRHHGCDHGVEGGDNTINAAEAADGIVITGTAEAGSTVLVNGVPATVAATHLHRHPAGSDRGRPAHVTVTRPTRRQHAPRHPDLTVDRGTTVRSRVRGRRSHRRHHHQRG
jgi:hypothetical protein